MATVANPIQTALVYHQAGQLDSAERIYRQILQDNPRHAGAMNLLGLIALQRRSYDVAVRLISQAIRLDGTQPAFHANLGEAYRGLGNLTDAKACYRQVLRFEPRMAEAHNNLGTLWQAERRFDEAMACYQRAIELKPDYSDALNNLGTLHQEQAHWDAALDCYRRAATAQPNYAKAYFNQGLVLEAQAQLDQARTAFSRALELEPSYAEARCSLAGVLRQQGQLAEAEAAYREALGLQPTLAVGWSGLGVLYQSQDKLAEAIGCYQQALRVQPNYAEAHYNYGTALKAQNQLPEAVACYRRAIECKPGFADAHYNLGTVLQKLNRYDQAATAYQDAIRLAPDYALAYNNLGNIHKIQGDWLRAVECYEQALRIIPDQGETFNNLGSLLQEQGKLTETVQCYRNALRAKPDCAEVYNNLGTALQEHGQLAKALACYDKSLKLSNDFPEAHYNRALLKLSQERFLEAWPDFAWRSKCKGVPAREFRQPRWDGGPLEGRTLLVHAEQGYGDTLQFIRYVSELRRRGGRLIVEVQARLLPLLKLSGFHEVVAAGMELGPFDVHLPLLDLPGVFQTTVESIPAEVPYLSADPRLIELWRERLSQFGGKRVGIQWQGNRDYAFDRHRSMPLKEFLPLAKVPGLQLFSLQKGEGIEQLPTVARQLAVHDLGPELDEQTGAFMDTAAVMKNLDLVITSDTATAHLAGALGVPVWVATGFSPEWRWLLNREDSPWYPTMRLFRQASPTDWRGVFERMAEELASRAS